MESKRIKIGEAYAWRRWFERPASRVVVVEVMGGGRVRIESGGSVEAAFVNTRHLLDTWDEWLVAEERSRVRRQTQIEDVRADRRSRWGNLLDRLEHVGRIAAEMERPKSLNRALTFAQVRRIVDALVPEEK